jgi:NitT/TauT family transport system ATP-binding protein
MGTTATEEPLLSLRSVIKQFATGLVAVENVSLTVAPGEFLSLLGPSGCGKSTLLRIIAGLDAPTRGAIEWLHAAGRRPPLGFVFQEPNLMPWATVAENVRLPLRLAGRHSDWRRVVQAALERVGLGAFAGSYPRELSGGMRMRVSLARAIVSQPELLLLDEPFAALDEITRTALNHDLLALAAEQHWTVIFVTHSVYESVFLSDRVAVMSPRPGRIATELVIDLPRPRTEALRLTSEYAQLCGRVSSELQQAMAREDVA